jgi:hypothetical protein
MKLTYLFVFIISGSLLAVFPACQKCKSPKHTSPVAITCSSCSPTCTMPSCQLPVAMARQEQTQWCWAACGQMCMQYLGYNVSQCQMANDTFRRSDCCCPDCVPPSTFPDIACNNPVWPNFSHYNFSYTQSDEGSALSFCDIQNQTGCLGKPFAFSWTFNGGGGAHMMVATGFSTATTNDTSQWVYINNPLAPKGTPISDAQVIISYCEYLSGSYYSHGHDYYNLSNNNDPTKP